MARGNPMRLALFLLVLFVECAWSFAPVEVLGLFRDRAVIRTAGGDVMLRVGETKQGVTLLAADASKASVRFAGETYDLALSTRVAGNFQRAEQARVVVASDRFGQYQVRGAVNNQFTNFLVDTGASLVALSSELASAMNIDYAAGKQGSVQTAQGQVAAYFVVLDTLVVGSITVYNVEAAVIEGTYPQTPLLGMSFLKQVSIEESAGVLTLTKDN